jgi:hypothetical protein
MPSKFDKLKKEINDLLEDYIYNNNPFLNCEFNDITLVETPKDNNTHFQNLPRLGKEALAFSSILEKCLGMYEAGRNHYDVYKQLYAYADPSEEDFKKFIELKKDGYKILDPDLHNTPINLDEKYTEKFIVELLRRSQEIHSTSSDIANSKNSRFFILGEVGVGKTTFLNNVFSIYHDKLKEKKVFWVRVDLTKSHLRGRSLIDALHFQMSKIFRGHYYECLTDGDRTELKTALISCFKLKDKVYNEDEFNACYEDFARLYDRERTEKYDSRIEFGLRKYIGKNYGLICIFDGLDRIAESQKFEDKINEIKAILTSEKYKCIFIFVMRDKSHCECLEHLLNYETVEETGLRGQSKLLRIIPPKLDDIIDKRINLLINRSSVYLEKIEPRLYQEAFDITEQDKEKIKSIQSKIGKMTKDDYDAYLNIFFMFLYKGLSKDNEIKDIKNLKAWDRKQAITELKNIVGNNFRKLLAIIQAANKIFLEIIDILGYQIWDIIDINNVVKTSNEKDDYTNYKEKLSKIFSRSYRIVDVLLRRSGYFENPYIYEYSNMNIQSKNKGLDMGKIPYIYNLYYSVNVSNIIEEKYYLLLKIRILQYISKNPNIMMHDKKSIGNYFLENFYYSKKHTGLAFNELINWGLIKNEIHVAGETIYYTYRLSRSGNYLLDTLFKDFSYIRLIIDDILIPKDFKHLFVDNHYKHEANTQLEIIIRQFPRVVNFISLIYSIELQEIIKPKKDKEWLIYKKIYDTILDIFTKICIKDDPNLELLKKALLDKGITEKID